MQTSNAIQIWFPSWIIHWGSIGETISWVVELHFPPSPFFSAASNLHFIIFFQIDWSSPRCDNKEVHEVPRVSHVAALVQHEAQGQDLGQHLRGEHHHEYNLHLFLQEEFVYFSLKKKLDHPTSLIDMIDLSLFESLSSRAMTTQFAMMVMMMIHSKGGQLTWN